MRPNFLIIGAGKCGTTSLAAFLSQHPQVYVSNPKEPGFFSENFHRGWAWYESLFADSATCSARGEASVNYSKCHLYPHVASQIAAGLGDVRIIYIARNPLDRIVSEWRYRVLNYLSIPSFSDSVLHNPDYILTSDYSTQISHFLKIFPKNHIMVLFSEDLMARPLCVLEDCCSFLRISPHSCWDLSPHGVSDKTVALPSSIVKIKNLAYPIRSIIPSGFQSLTFSLFGRKSSDIAALRSPTVWGSLAYAKTLDSLYSGSLEFLVEWGKDESYWNFDRPTVPD
ncbi:sulfotransferase domain-containing protein [Synechococcus sp. CS-1325]|uniref:sulfotransferase domain-containing protein n=1 Tax=unclassified Synechococcus TaxID=2626047 RepID=UPI0021A8CF8E|nr:MULTISPECIES: sulfotransferase domain-containing protein [unclassified Synechococcus]MCT0200803.1 sulfotransferase domain-containing protein [Synechococcus sp. CS-1325]MCT0213842.1 sulfotransferase domain-containing protein [Synechococcus sp. CS-1326]MCT0233418.1 sulfotransferase domain-containing protein [Synechococcus sp. CS-1327]